MTHGWWNGLRENAAQRLFSRLLPDPLVKAAKPAPVRDTFCILAWKHLQIDPNGCVKMCCAATEYISDGKRPMSLYTDAYEDIWNSDYMRAARRGLATGERISPCRRCFEREDVGGVSPRTESNAVWLPKSNKSREEFIQSARSNDWRISERPISLQLNMGNLCNLACRMCTSVYSSKIEHDPVQSKWIPASHTDVARWRGNKLHVGPRPFFGITYEGFYAYEGYAGIRWCSGSGTLKLKIPDDTEIVAVGLSLRTPGKPLPGMIRVNGLEVFEGTFSADWARRFELHGLRSHRDFEVQMKSATVNVGGRVLGVGLLDVWLERNIAGRAPYSNERTLMRYSGNESWWAQPEVMFDEILGEPSRLRHLICQGGEPFLVKEFERILDVLISNNSAKEVTFEIISNVTMIKDSTLSKLTHLKQILLGASIDGIGPTLEYIRYPAVWGDIEQNLDRLAALPNIVINFNTAVQAYNLGDVVNILSYCDQRGIDSYMHFLDEPAYLNVAVLPKKVRSEAIDRLSTYIDGVNVRSKNRVIAEYMITFLKKKMSIQYRDQFTNFMKFTNDMDVSRGQDFRALYPELVSAFAEDGFKWTNENQFAKTNSPTLR